MSKKSLLEPTEAGTLIRDRSRFSMAVIGAISLVVLSVFTLHARATQFQPRVVGGINVSIDFAPSIVGILDRRRFDTFSSSFQSIFCGGTVIQEDWVLTAAHCLVDGNGNDREPSSIIVTMGASELDGGNETRINVTEVILHESFISTVRGDDIALLRLASPAVVQPTPLETGEIVLNRDARIAGWGALNSSDDGEQIFPSLLKGTIVNMVPGEDCNTRFSVYTGKVTSRQLCAGVADGGRDTCQGDSGGPIYRIGDDSEITLAGITSWGNSCALADSPGIYTRVGAYTNWINGKIQGDEPGVNISTNPLSGSSGGGSAAAFLLLPLGLIAVLRRTTRKVTALRYMGVVLVLTSSLGCLSVQPLVAGDPSMITLSSLEQALGEEMSTQLPDLQSLWQESAACTAKKTGVGVNRRAYFLDMCRFDNTAKLSACGHVPTAAEYHFLEGKLVQVSLHFDKLANDLDLASCVTAEEGYQIVEQLGTDSPIYASDQRSVMVKKEGAVGVIVEPAMLTIMNAELAPEVQVLQAMFATPAK